MKAKFSIAGNSSDFTLGLIIVTHISIFQRTQMKDAKMISIHITDSKMIRVLLLRINAFTIILCAVGGWKSGRSSLMAKRINLEQLRTKY